VTTVRGVDAHTDFGGLTLLRSDIVSGLQIFHPKTQIQIDVGPIAEPYVVNLGDTMQLWTGGMHRSILHRMIITTGSKRYSIAVFNGGRQDHRVKRINVGEGTENEEGITVGEHLKKIYKGTMS